MANRKPITSVTAISPHDFQTLKLCIASAWLYESISRGRAEELAKSLGIQFFEIDDLKAINPRNIPEISGLGGPDD